MNISHDDAQLLMRALKTHSSRMMKIAESESMIGNHSRAKTAVDEAKMADALYAKFQQQGVRIL